MARVELAPEVPEDFDRSVDHLVVLGADDPPARVAELIQGLQTLTHSPLIGRLASAGKCELVISSGARGYVALYRRVANLDVVFVLAVRGQREAGFQDIKRPARG